jgi:hypothetical protein
MRLSKLENELVAQGLGSDRGGVEVPGRLNAPNIRSSELTWNSKK